MVGPGTVGGAYDGSYKLGFTAGQCEVCDGNWDGVYARSAKVDVTPGDTIMLRFMEKIPVTLEGQAGVPGYALLSLRCLVTPRPTRKSARASTLHGGWKYRRHVMAGASSDVVQVALRFGLIDLWGKIMDVDFIH